MLRPFGHGLWLETGTSIPRGSGLGTSSILAGAILKCLALLLGQDVTQAKLFDEVLCLEQMITTGGGWQDQVGGLVPGIKLITTESGLPQHPHIERVALTPGIARELGERLVLVFTGQRRLAKNLLRSVMGRWMARDPEMVSILDEIAQLASEMRAQLEAGNLDKVGKLLGVHWEINKRMDPGCTNPFIDGLFDLAAPYLAGAKLAGAGGGGFAFGIARDAAARDELGAVLVGSYPRSGTRAWPCSVAEQAAVVASQT